MKCLRFNFCHPVRGYASLTQLAAPRPQYYRITIDSKGTNLVEVPIAECQIGKWRIVLDWEFEGKWYSHQKDFEVKKNTLPL